MKIKGKPKLKITAEGLLKIDRRLALVMANMAFIWLYDDIQLILWDKHLEKSKDTGGMIFNSTKGLS